MALRINQNIAAYNAHRNLTLTDSMLSKSLERLSSGLRINRAADDAAGLSISEKLRSQVRGLQQAMRNAQDGISLIQTAEGALQETHAILQRMRELAVQASNGTLTDDDRAAIKQELDALVEEVTRIAQTTTYNSKVLLAGDGSGNALELTFFVGAENIDPSGSTPNKIKVSVPIMVASDLGEAGSDTGVDISVPAPFDQNAAIDYIATLDTAIKTVSDTRAALGAVQNRLEHTIANLGVAVENISASESRIRDVDMAAEMVNFTRQQIMIQAGTAMLAQANAVPQTVLQLLR